LTQRSAIVLGALAFGVLAIQLVPVDRSNPPAQGEIQAPAEVMQVLRESCFDCHSIETTWPWYSRVAPVSWLVAWDVAEAREELNFSSWSQLDAEEQSELREEIWEEVEEEEMPLWYYLPTHPEARLTEQDRQALRAWSNGGARHDGH